MNDKLIRYIKGIASAEERKEVLEWAKESPDNEKELIRMKADYIFSTLPDKDPSDTAISAIKRSTQNIKAIKIWAYIGSAAAAVILAFALLTFHTNSRLYKNVDYLIAENNRLNTIPELVQNESLLEYHVNPGVQGTVFLSDGSEVILNCASTLKSPSRFENGKRVVELEGEGYFKIKTNPDWPMFVRTQKGYIVKVTGTEFNLSSYSNDKDTKLTLVHGKVSLMADGHTTEVAIQEKEEIVIPDNSSISSVKRKIADMRLNTSWKDGFLVFDNTPIEEVIKKMERWYGVSIHINNDAVLNNVFTASFNSESLRQVLDLMKLTCGINFMITDTFVDLF